MIVERKTHFIAQLEQSYQSVIRNAHQAESQAAETSEHIRRESRRKEDSKGSVEFGRMAASHKARRERAVKELETLVAFSTKPLRALAETEPVQVGSLIDVRITDGEGEEERTLFLLPVGAGNELTGPGGDGFISVITPASPVGRALTGGYLGESFDISIDGKEREWTIVDLC